jgi:hypothetical protein
MGQGKKKRRYEYNDTAITLHVALFCGACAVLTVESIAGDAMHTGWQLVNRVPVWQLNMGSVCGGIITFFVFLFILEFLETKSRITAWRSSAPWLPLVGVTALATVFHIPIYIVFLVGVSYAVWAYRRTSSVRSSSRSSKGKEIA